MKDSVAIVGYGHVGQGMQRIFPNALIIDPEKGYHGADKAGDYRHNAETCRLAIVCVPTPSQSDGRCDTSIVENVVSQLESDLILIKSTVTPGTSQALAQKYDKLVCFSPEYMGESRYWTPPWAPDPASPLSHGFMIIGGARRRWCADIADIFMPALGPATRFRFMSSDEAELVKYFENAFFALKVMFANEMRNVCEAMPDVDYHTVREGWLDDPRVGSMHTAAFKREPGFDGKCFPKDLAALANFCSDIGNERFYQFLRSVLVANDAIRRPTSGAL